MGSYSTVVFGFQIVLTLISTITALEESHNASGSHASQCNVCWSLVSAAQCQNSSKSEPCSPEQLDSTMNKMRMILPQSSDGSLSMASVTEHQVPYRCFTLSASAGNGDSKKVFYAKGCTTTTGDLCAGWVKEKSATCALCTGNNCNTAAPIEVSHSAIKLNNKNCSSSNSNRAGDVNNTFNWMVVVALLGSVYTAIFKQ